MRGENDARRFKIHVLALDYDGTIATDGVLDSEVRAAVTAARARGLTVMLVTGRIRADLQRLLPQPWPFDAIVAENGAVVQFPTRGRSLLLAPVPNSQFLDELRHREVPFLGGECIVEMDADFAGATLEIIRELELPLVIAFNRGRAMVLPQAISKSTGLRAALRVLRSSLHDTAAVGDAENDHELLMAAEFGVAVSWGSEALKAKADYVLEGEGPAAVAAMIRGVENGMLVMPEHERKHRVHVGVRVGGEPLDLVLRDRNALVAGETQSGKSWVAGLVCEQLILQNYCVCVIDPEGEYGALESLPSVVVFDAAPSPPELDDVERTLRYPDVSVVLDLSAMEHDAKRAYAKDLLRRLTRLRKATGLPHHIVVDEAHYFLHDLDVSNVFDFDLAGYVLVSYRASQIHEAVLQHMDVVLVTRMSDPAEVTALRVLCDEQAKDQDWIEALADMRTNDAALLPGAVESVDKIVRFCVSKRLTPHIRHREKYLRVPVARGREFVFFDRGVELGRAHTLVEFREFLAQLDPCAEHLMRSDYSRWIRDTVSHAKLADDVRQIEEAWQTARFDDVHERIIGALAAYYASPSPQRA